MTTLPSEASVEEIARWIERVAAERDCSLPPPDRGPHARAVLSLISVISREFTEYRAVVAGAEDAAERNERALGVIVNSATRQGDLVRDAAGAVTEASAGAARVAGAAEDLQRFAVEAADAADGASEGLSEIRGALAALGERLAEGRGPIGEMNASTTGVMRFLSTLSRLSRQAQLLAVNAAIESAHLAEAGARFALVALEVRKLSVSTRTASGDVGRIVNELRSSTERVAAGVDGARTATGGAASDITLAASTLARTQATIGDFEETIDEIASIAGEQRASLATVAAGIGDIVRHADDAAAESRRASDIDVSGLLQQAAAVAASWREMRDAPPAYPADDEPFFRWLADLNASPDRVLEQSDPTIAVLGPPLLKLLAAADADATNILSNIVDIARAVGSNGFAWQTIEVSLAAVRDEIGAVRIAIGESVAAARTTAERSGAMRPLVDSMQRAYGEALGSLDGALGRISGISKSVGEIDDLVDVMTSAAAQASEILALIDTLSSETDLLSLNAAIEAAHAGDAGLGFGVIAEEIRMLALSTHTATQSVGELVEQIVGISDAMRASTGAVAGSTLSVTASADRVRLAIATLRESFAATMQRALDVFETAQTQARALDRVQEMVAQSGAVDFDAADTTRLRRVELATIGSRMHAVAARRPRGLAVESVRAFANDLAAEVERTVEAQIAHGDVGLEPLFDFRYHEIAGADIARLARLFDVRRVPPEGFVPPKFETPWDSLIDTAIMDLFERRFEELAAYGVTAIGLFDLNAFLWALAHRSIVDWTGDPAADHRGNRIKRIFSDDYSLRVARWGLGPRAEQLPPRVSYATIRDAGCTLGVPDGERPWGAYVYARDTTDVFNELGAAIYFRGRRHSTLRIVYGAQFI
jgi:methyl-accepting chemotaxis protein